MKVNNNDSYLTYGGILLQGANQELQKLPNAWPDETVTRSLPFAILGNGEVEFWAHYNAFRLVIQANADMIIEVPDLHRRFKLQYSSISNFELLSKITGPGRMGARMVLNLIDDYPDVYTSTRTQNFTPLNGLGTVSYSRTYSSYTQADANLLQAEDSTYLTDGQTFADGYRASNPVPVVSATYFGASASVPVNATQVKALPYLVGSGVMSFTINTGANRIIVIAIPVSKSVQSIFDNTTKEDLTLAYSLISNITVDTVSYKILALQNAVAFSTSHEHLIVLTNG